MKGIVNYHKTPKFGDISPDPASKTSQNSNGKKRTLSNIDNSKIPKPEKPSKTDSQKLVSKENKPNLPKPIKKSEVLEKKLDKILEIKEKQPEKCRSRSSFDSKEPEILQDLTNEVPRLPEPPNKDPPPEKKNIKDKIDFINQIFDSINNKRSKTDLQPPEEKVVSEKVSEKQKDSSLEKSADKSLSENHSEVSEEEDINPRRSRVFPESFVGAKELTKEMVKPGFEKKRSKEELEERKGSDKTSKNDTSIDRKSSFKREESSYHKPTKPSQSPLKKSIIKNFVQANKKNGLGRKMYENYEKLLKCFDSEVICNKEVNKSSIVSKSPIRKNIEKSPLKKTETRETINKSPLKAKELRAKLPPKPQESIPLKKNNSSKATLSRDSRRITNSNNHSETENIESMDMKNFYKEISNLTKTLNKAAALMNQTFKKIETLSRTPIKTKRETRETSPEYSSEEA